MKNEESMLGKQLAQDIISPSVGLIGIRFIWEDKKWGYMALWLIPSLFVILFFAVVDQGGIFGPAANWVIPVILLGGIYLAIWLVQVILFIRRSISFYNDNRKIVRLILQISVVGYFISSVVVLFLLTMAVSPLDFPSWVLYLYFISVGAMLTISYTYLTMDTEFPLLKRVARGVLPFIGINGYHQFSKNQYLAGSVLLTVGIFSALGVVSSFILYDWNTESTLNLSLGLIGYVSLNLYIAVFMLGLSEFMVLAQNSAMKV